MRGAAERALQERVDAAHVERALEGTLLASKSAKDVGILSRAWRPIAAVGVAAVLVLALVLNTDWIKPRVANQYSTQSDAITYTTRNAQTARVTLRDGSVVILAPATVAIVNGRDVTLKGEAAFQVEPSNTSPFLVHASNTTVRVLGTEFAVRAYGNDVKVAVRSGRVGVADNVLESGSVLSKRAGALEIVRDTDVAQAFSFTTGRLSLDGVALGDAVDDLNRWFDADVRVTDPELRSRPFVGSLPPGSLNDLATALRVTLGARVIQRGRIITITPDGAKE